MCRPDACLYRPPAVPRSWRIPAPRCLAQSPDAPSARRTDGPSPPPRSSPSLASPPPPPRHAPAPPVHATAARRPGGARASPARRRIWPTWRRRAERSASKTHCRCRGSNRRRRRRSRRAFARRRVFARDRARRLRQSPRDVPKRFASFAFASRPTALPRRWRDLGSRARGGGDERRAPRRRRRPRRLRRRPASSAAASARPYPAEGFPSVAPIVPSDCARVFAGG